MIPFKRCKTVRKGAHTQLPWVWLHVTCTSPLPRSQFSTFLPVLPSMWDSRGSNDDLYSCCCLGGTASQGLCVRINTCGALGCVQYIQSYWSKKRRERLWKLYEKNFRCACDFLGFILSIWKQQVNWNSIWSGVFVPAIFPVKNIEALRYWQTVFCDGTEWTLVISCFSCSKRYTVLPWYLWSANILFLYILASHHLYQ